MLQPPSDELPAYSGPPDPSAPPPAYPRLLPETFKVGSHDVEPLVQVDALIAHLRVLAAFKNLKSSVERANKPRLDAAAAWTVFLCRAVHRFEKWVRATDCDLQDRALPPLDVLMVWHSYMLNPLAYEEDGNRLLLQLKHLRAFPLKGAAQVIDAETLEMNVSADTRLLFEAATHEAFAMPLVTSPSDRVLISCPCCEDGSKKLPRPWIDDSATGWAQRDFRAKCPYCRRRFTHESYGVRRLCDEVIMWRDKQRSPHSRDTFFLRGTSYPKVRGKAQAVLQRMFSHAPDWGNGATFARMVDWKMKDFETWCLGPFKSSSKLKTQTPPRVSAILRRYSFPGPFSIELISAVMRQGSFTEKMVSMGWTRPSRFRDDAGPLVRAIARYHAFLDLGMWDTPRTFLVPTLDIDLVWHTHQLNAANYRRDTKLLVGSVLDHDDKVEENTLSNGFDTTAEAWRKRFGVPYSLCGCISASGMPESSTSRTIRRVASVIPTTLHRRQRSQSSPPAAAPQNEHPELISIADEDAGSSHPSDHNSILLNSPAALVKRRTREIRYKHILEQQTEEVKRGRADVWTITQETRRTRSQDCSLTAPHEQSFFRPLPHRGVGSNPYGSFGISGSACAAYGGGVAFNAGANHYASSECGIGAGGSFCRADDRGGFSACGTSFGVCGGIVGIQKARDINIDADFD